MNEKYIAMAIGVFEDLQRMYELKLTATDTILNYSGKLYSFSVYFEKYFEFYICFHLNHAALRLYDIAVWLGFENRDIVALTNNQVANEHDAKFVLENLHTVLKKLLRMLQKKPELLVEFLESQKYEKQNLLSKTILTSIQQAWKAKQFEKFLMLVDANRATIKQSKRAMIVFKQETYIKKLRGQGDSSPVSSENDPTDPE